MKSNKYLSLKQFSRELFKVIHANILNDHRDNWDQYRFGPESVRTMRNRLGDIKRNVSNYGKYLLNSTGFMYLPNNTRVGDILFHFQYLYNLLESEHDQRLLLKILAFRILGHRKVRLPLNTAEHWRDIDNIEQHLSKTDIIDIGFMNFQFSYSDLAFLNLPIKMYANPLGLYIDFIVKQYEYHEGDVHIEACNGDIVIDGGGCYGDTALYFANKIGTSGSVHVFEFIPDNIKLFNKNIDLNDALKEQILLVDHPLWSVSGLDVFYKSNGPASQVSMEFFDGFSGKTSTLSIDDYVIKTQLPRVDLIKMDIEGAETQALLGSIETIRKYKPKLAIALYHSPSDFERIPKFISELNLGYKFYLKHATIFGEETMLFASAK